MILTKHEETKKGRFFHENEKLRIFVSSCSINYLYQVIFLSSLSKQIRFKQRISRARALLACYRKATGRRDSGNLHQGCFAPPGY